ncbi:hypothetical protein [Flavihumibacter petaseus]|uniref:Uncharacterized protein n=1 Tax=Flavihumibacter petaseus NBRC 106054 TaxID=1220578 RepID=A0A0E9N3T8_9BACT|nr:hypothetical protein [Flavihumibacter petaseus]GAO44443.1 hypothetical protein FPE01S_03_04800 [Flavihumibacter petaseus NBRC 106054]
MELKLLVVLMPFLANGFNLSNSQNRPIYLLEFDCTIQPISASCNEKISAELEDGTSLTVQLSDCKGRMHITQLKNKIIVQEGDYINSLGLLRKYYTRVDGISGKQSIRIFEYYQPLRNGTWRYYNDKGKLIKQQMFNKGIEVPLQ